MVLDVKLAEHWMYLAWLHVECTGGSGVKGVAETVHVTEKTIDSGRSKFSADPGQVALDDVAVGRLRCAPDRLEDHLAGVDPARVAHEW